MKSHIVLALVISASFPRAQVPEGYALLVGANREPLVMNSGTGEVTAFEAIVIPPGTTPSGLTRQDPMNPDTLVLPYGLLQSVNRRAVFVATRYDGRRRVSWSTFDPLAVFATEVGAIDYQFHGPDMIVNLYFNQATVQNGIYAIQPWPNGAIRLITPPPTIGTYWAPSMSIAGDTAVLGEGSQVSFLDLRSGVTVPGPIIQSIEPRSVGIDQILALSRDQAVVLDQAGFILLVDRAGGQVLGFMPGAPTQYRFNGLPVMHPTMGLLIPWMQWMYRVGTPATRLYQVALPRPSGLWVNQLSTFRGPSILQYGTACRSGIGTPPRIGATGVPGIGNAAFALEVSIVPPLRAAWLLLGADRGRLGGSTPLPLDLTSLGLTGCMLETDVLVVTGTATRANGTASMPLPIPNVPAFAGTRLTSQWVVESPPGESLPLWWSEGCELHVRR